MTTIKDLWTRWIARTRPEEPMDGYDVDGLAELAAEKEIGHHFLRYAWALGITTEEVTPEFISFAVTAAWADRNDWNAHIRHFDASGQQYLF